MTTSHSNRKPTTYYMYFKSVLYCIFCLNLIFSCRVGRTIFSLKQSDCWHFKTCFLLMKSHFFLSSPGEAMSGSTASIETSMATTSSHLSTLLSTFRSLFTITNTTQVVSAHIYLLSFNSYESIKEFNTEQYCRLFS